MATRTVTLIQDCEVSEWLGRRQLTTGQAKAGEKIVLGAGPRVKLTPMAQVEDDWVIETGLHLNGKQATEEERQTAVTRHEQYLSHLLGSSDENPYGECFSGQYRQRQPQ